MLGDPNSATEFTEAHLVMNDASDLYVCLLAPTHGKHARAALFQNKHGLDVSIEAEMTVRLKQQY